MIYIYNDKNRDKNKYKNKYKYIIVITERVTFYEMRLSLFVLLTFQERGYH